MLMGILLFYIILLLEFVTIDGNTLHFVLGVNVQVMLQIIPWTIMVFTAHVFHITFLNIKQMNNQHNYDVYLFYF